MQQRVNTINHSDDTGIAMSDSPFNSLDSDLTLVAEL